MKKALLILVPLLASTVCGRNIDYSKRYEGFKDSKLSVYVRIAGTGTLRDTNLSYEKKIIARARKRAVLILKNYIAVNCDRSLYTGDSDQMLQKYLKNPVIRHMEFTEKESCKAFVEFDVINEKGIMETCPPKKQKGMDYP